MGRAASKNSKKPYKHYILLQLVPVVGLGLNYPLLHGKYAHFHWLLNINPVIPRIPYLTLLVSVSVSV
jgi:hypothetical protein